MFPLVAHQGGWDEIALAVGGVLVVLVPRLIIERRRRKRIEAEQEAGSIEEDVEA